MKKYFPNEIEPKWQKKWQEKSLYSFKSDSKKKKYYNLVELPYPSGDLHFGHWFSFVPADAHARFKRMSGFNVFFPNGFDAFGLPAENAAIKRGVHPKDWTMKNIEAMTKQFATMGTMIDWDYTAITCLPEYYRWNQWIFLKMFEKGLAYRGKALSNWCPVDNTVLANEHIEAGKCWRCGSEVIQKEVEQWFLAITKYADKLIWPENTESVGRQSRFSDDARRTSSQSSKLSRSLSESLSSNSKDNQNEKVTAFGSPQSELAPSGQNHKSSIINHKSRIDWPKEVREGQNNWIGKSEGMLLDFGGIEVFTTRPETTDGATFLVVAPEHSFVAELLNSKDKKQKTINKEIKEYVEEAKKKTEMERKEDRAKSGIFTGKYVKNPVTGRQVPVWISDYVLAGYGTGAIMAVPFADERDREFAEKFKLPIIETSFKAKPEGKKRINYHLRDWSISRQRYWGTPIPIIYCRKCWEIKNHPFDRLRTKIKSEYGKDFIEIDGQKHAMIQVPLEDLPVELPYNVDYTPKGKPPLATDEQWLAAKCPKCDEPAKRDAETLDTFFDSAWYYYRYVSPNFEKGPFDTKEVEKLMPVDVYVGGAEHTLGHTLYARFFTKFFKELGLVSFDEFASKRVQHGVILGPDGNRMSKSRGNVVSPEEVVKEYGTDTARLYLCFMMPYEATAPWSTNAISGIYRFLKRVWDLQSAISNQPSAISSKDLFRMHSTIKKVGEDLDNFHFNTGVAALMTWLNFLSAKKEIGQEEYAVFLKLLSPFAPHITEELWSRGARSGSARHSIHLETWPEYNPQYLVEDKVSIVVQVNGKVRDTVIIQNSELRIQNRVEEEAKKSDKVRKYLEGKQIKKVIYVEGKILNFVV